MSTPKQIVTQAYEAFVRGDVDGILKFVADDVDWEFIASSSAPVAGRRCTKQEVKQFFADVQNSDDVSAFEWREFIEAGQDLTVLGWEKATALDSGTQYTTDWVHVFTVKDDKITRWRGFANTAARYGK